MDEWEFLGQFACASPGQLVRLVSGASAEQLVTLGAYLGGRRAEEFRQLAARAVSRGNEAGRKPVAFVPGFLGSSLVVSKDGRSESTWLDLKALRGGGFRGLRLRPDGRAEYDGAADVRVSGVLNAIHGELLLRLAVNWDVRAFAYDWRGDASTIAAGLEAFLRAEFGDEPVRIVAHSTGVTAVRALLARRQESPSGPPIERVIALGEPIGGSFVVPRILAGIDPMVTRLASWASLGTASASDDGTVTEVAKALASFPALYQMLPRSSRLLRGGGRAGRSVEAFYRVETYASYPVVVPEGHLRAARSLGGLLDRVEDDGDVPIVRIHGYGQTTPTGLEDPSRGGDIASYQLTALGDGVAPCPVPRTRTADAPGIYFVRAPHGGLPSSPDVLRALDELLVTGDTDRLRREPPAGPDSPPDPDTRRRGADRRDRAFDHLLRRLSSRDALASRAAPDTPVGRKLRAAAQQVSPDVRAMEERLAGDFHAATEEEAGAGPGGFDDDNRRPTPSLSVSLIHAGIESAHLFGEPGQGGHPPTGFAARRFMEMVGRKPVDAIAVGHYLGVPSQGPELALDRSISRVIRERENLRIRDLGPDSSDLMPLDGLVLSQFAERGILRGELGQPFFLDDPRPGGPEGGRLIAIAGMGIAGRFGSPELTVLARELTWSLGRLGKRHLATVLIGSGAGNLSLADALHAWFRGIGTALNGVSGRHPHLEQVTFVEFHPGRVEELNRAIQDEVVRNAPDLQIDYTPWTPDELEDVRARADEFERSRRRRREDGSDRIRSSTRVSVQIEGDTYTFGAITETASIPERRIPLRRNLVERANSELAGESDLDLQLDRGRFLGRLLIPEDLRSRFFTPDPLVLMLDASTARVHWEMVAQSEGDFSPGQRLEPRAIAGEARRFPEEYYLGTARGVTRQLRTTFAPPPEPPPPPRRVLRVLVVADPAEDAHLEGALQEGVEVADLFDAFNNLYRAAENKIDVKRLFGPGQATITNVLREVMSRPYDVFHFAGHCFFNEDDPGASGWVFSRGEVLTADLLNRIDRIPKFVFSNACESGVTPDRPEGYSGALAPSFAESFFQRGVANFVCTAWPVDDLAARRFAAHLYGRLLGIETADGGHASRSGRFDPMYRAMLEARLKIARRDDGSFNPEAARTWGAYQHYGDPFFRFFQERSLD